MFFLLVFAADKYKDSTPDGAKNADNTAKNAEPLINLDGECATSSSRMGFCIFLSFRNAELSVYMNIFAL